MCVTKWNAGDSNGPIIPSGIQISSYCDIDHVKTRSCCYGGFNTACEKAACYYVGSSDEEEYCRNCECYNSSSAGAYSSLNRTICMYDAAETICNSWAPNGTVAGDWHLPTSAELTKIKNYVASNGRHGIQLCTMGVDTVGSKNSCTSCYSSTASVPQNTCEEVSTANFGDMAEYNCTKRAGYCDGIYGSGLSKCSYTAYSTCQAHILWGQSSSLTMKTQANTMTVSSVNVSSTSSNNYKAYSVRCVSSNVSRAN